MKNNIGLVLLALLALILAVALIVIRQQAGEKQKQDTATILDLSNQWTKASAKVDEFSQVNVELHNDLAASHTLLADLSNNLTTASETVTNLGNSLAVAQGQVASENTRIADLQQQNKDLNVRAATLTSEEAELTNRIAALNDQIQDTQHQLAESKTDNGYLEKQLQQLILARAELEHKFETLASVRQQLKKLEEDIYTARRLRWIKEGTDTPQKGGPLMVKYSKRGSGTGSNDNYGLHVELGTDGSIRTVPSDPTTTNNPATNSFHTNTSSP